VGIHPDVNILKFIDTLDESLSQSKNWQKENKVKVILGVNGRDALQV